MKFRTVTRAVSALVLALGLSAFAAPAFAGPVNVNKASAEEIAEALNGVGVKKAREIVAFREKQGPFKSVDQLLDVKGIGEKMLEKNRPNIRLQ